MGRKKNTTSEMDVMEKQSTPLASRLSELINDSEALRKHLDVSLQAINQYKLGTSRPSLDNLCKIADYYNVSVDWLIGRPGSSMRGDADVTAAIKCTGLSEKAIQILNASERLSECNYLFEHGYIEMLSSLLFQYKHHWDAIIIEDAKSIKLAKEASARGNGYIDLHLERTRNNDARRGIKADLIECVLRLTQEMDSIYQKYVDAVNAPGVEKGNGKH